MSTKWKLPPKAKVYEALSAVADNRVRILDDTHAEVTSSGHDKTYLVEWTKDFRKITSNDNASYWQGYLGYPILAVLLASGRLTCDREVASSLAGVHWKKINAQYKNKYDQAVEHVLQDREQTGVSRANIIETVDNIFHQLGAFEFEKLAGSKPPPKVR